MLLLLRAITKDAHVVSMQQQRLHLTSKTNNSQSSAQQEGGDARAQQTQQQPFVLLLDMDGTMIGHIIPQVCEYELLNAVQEMTARDKLSSPSTKSGSGSASKLKAMKAGLVERLRYGVLRPHMDWFVKTASSGLPNMELFVYTASDDGWAKFIVPCIEEVLGIKFNRPLFTRKHCVYVDNEYKKSLDKVMPVVHKKLRTKYKLPPTTSESVKQLGQRAALLDNNPTVLLHSSDAPRLIRCPTYNFAYHYDVLGNVDVPFLHARFRSLIPYLAKMGMFPNVLPSEVQSAFHFLHLYHERLAENVRGTWLDQDALQKDRMWRALGDSLFGNATLHTNRFSADGVRYLNERLASSAASATAATPSNGNVIQVRPVVLPSASNNSHNKTKPVSSTSHPNKTTSSPTASASYLQRPKTAPAPAPVHTHRAHLRDHASQSLNKLQSVSKGQQRGHSQGHSQGYLLNDLAGRSKKYPVSPISSNRLTNTLTHTRRGEYTVPSSSGGGAYKMKSKQNIPKVATQQQQSLTSMLAAHNQPLSKNGETNNHKKRLASNNNSSHHVPHLWG